LIAAFISGLFLQQVSAQVSSKIACQQRAESIAKGLDADDPRRAMIGRGESGDCRRRPWMDELKRLGIKRVHLAFIVDEKDASILNLCILTFHSDYGLDSPLLGAETIKPLEDTDLVQKIQDFVFEHVRSTIRTMQGNDMYDIDVTDDEALPILEVLARSNLHHGRLPS
jgi:hypothetical protein